MERKPNIVLILTDDQGYADAACYGATDIETPNLDRMAREGVRFTDYYSSHASCSPSRAGLLTGCYPVRVRVPEVLGPQSEDGLSPDETTIATMLRPLGYVAACFGKWHLGHLPQYLPTNHGFDSFFGLPYSNDMWRQHPDPGYAAAAPPLMLMENDVPVREIATMADQDELTTLYTERATAFIRANRVRPFFLYLAHNMPHVPLAVSSKFRGKSPRGIYGDVIMEIDWSVGEVMRTLEEEGLADNTLVCFSSDNGPWLSYGTHAGSAGPLREGKNTTFDGGQRVICLAWWPGTIPPGQVRSEHVIGIDILPTIAEITGAALPVKPIDGKSIFGILTDGKLEVGKRESPGGPDSVTADRPPVAGPNSGPPTPEIHEAIFFHLTRSGRIEAVRMGRWKLHFPHDYQTLAGRTGRSDGLPVPYERATIGLELFDLQSDIGETRNVAPEHPGVVERMVAVGLAHAEEVNRHIR